MISNNTVVINLIAGPCAGKSTVAAQLFAELKKTGMAVELLQEPIKTHIYEDHRGILTHQIALFGEQLYKLDSLVGKVDCVVNDGSLLLNAVYDQSNNQLFKALVMQEYNRFKNLDFFINRGDIEFQSYGRIHTYEQSLMLDKKIKDVYDFANATYIDVDSVTAVDEILTHIQSFGKGS